LRYTASADAGIIPYPALDLLNQYYCTPNKTFEFLVAGLPIVANDLPELRRFVADQGAGINMPMNTSDDIARAIESLFAADLVALRSRVQALSREYVWDTQGRTLVSAYEALLS
jgi:glycosyltransferase involved in cell wall biosynthesis